MVGGRSMLGVLLLIGMTAIAGEPAVRARVDSTSYIVGDPVVIELEFTHGEGVLIAPLFGDTLGAFAVLASPLLERREATRTSGSLMVSYYDSGAVEIPALRFSATGGADSLSRTIGTDPIPVRFSLVPVDTSAPIRDLKPPISIPLSLTDIALYAGLGAAFFALLYLLYRLWKKRKGADPEGLAAESVSRPAHLIALEELGKLKQEALWQKGLAKEYYSRLSGILRRYFEDRYRIPALEETTSEILRSLGTRNLPDDVMESVRSLLVQSDLVKFAKHLPDVRDYEPSMDQARLIVERTKEAAEPSIAAGHEEGGMHVGA